MVSRLSRNADFSLTSGWHAILEGEDMEIDDEYLLDETTAPTPDETPTPTTPAAPTTSGIKLKLTLTGKNKNISGSSSSTTTTTTTTTPNITNAEAGASTSGRTGARGKRPATGKADAAAFEDDASQASVGTSKGKSTRASKRVKLDVSSGQCEVADADLSDALTFDCREGRCERPRRVSWWRGYVSTDGSSARATRRRRVRRTLDDASRR